MNGTTRYNDTLNQNLNVPMTRAQRDIVEQLAYRNGLDCESYPYGVPFMEVTMEQVTAIADLCVDTEDECEADAACGQILRWSPEAQERMNKLADELRADIERVLAEMLPNFPETFLEHDSRLYGKTYRELITEEVETIVEMDGGYAYDDDDIREAIQTVILEHLG